MTEIELESYFKIAIWGSPVVVLFLLILSAFFSGSETALTASSRPKLRSMSDRGSNGAKKALDITNDNESLIGTILLGNNIVNILATSLATAYFVRFFVVYFVEPSGCRYLSPPASLSILLQFHTWSLLTPLGDAPPSTFFVNRSVGNAKLGP